MKIPHTFLWTRIGPEGGFDLDQILYWKEMQRRLSGGEFWWGIGTAPARHKLDQVLGQKRPKVLFSVQKTQRHGERRPRLLWTRYIGESGIEKKLPKYALVTSESSPGRTQYAIRATSLSPIQRIKTDFDTGLYRHLRGKSDLGQTVTAVLERDPVGVAGGPYYDYGFAADLAGLHVLSRPVELDPNVVRVLDYLVFDRPSITEFKATVATILKAAD
ncbi:UNVERIFIED_ORG: hypothetical protein GGE44_004102 [Rhizobium esperanzae]